MAPLLGFIFAFSPPLPVCDPQTSVSYSGKRKQKQLQIGALTHSDWGVGGMMATTKVCAKCLLRQRPEDSCNRVGCTCSGGSPSQWPQKQGLACEGYGYPTPCTPVKNDTSFPRQTTLPLGAFPPRRHSVFTPVLYPHGQKQSSSWICSLNPMLQHLSPLQHWQIPVSGRRVQDRLWRLCDRWCSGPQSLHRWRRPWLEVLGSLFRWVSS